MNKANAKKQYERFLLEQFLATSEVKAEIVDDSGEAPDFILQIDQELVGVEVTELFTSQDDDTKGTLQGQESLAQRIVVSASQIYRASGAQHAHVSVVFASGCDLRKLNRDQTASQLAAFVQAQTLSPRQIVQWRPGYVTNPLPDAIVFVNMVGVPSPDMAHWSSPSSGWVVPMTEAKLQTRINEKAALLPKYARRITPNWLLLVADGGKPSQFFEAPTKEVASAVLSPFARTFYFGLFKRTVIELGISPR